MIVPQFWAEGRCHQPRREGRQVTVRRFGWSDTSQADAQAHADRRAEEAFRRVLAGEKLSRRELKRSYDGTEGVPIREEIVGRHGDMLITRNLYGARCLNTPDVFFADIDFRLDPSFRFGFTVFLVMLVCAVGVLVAAPDKKLGSALAGATLFLALPLIPFLHWAVLGLRGGPKRIAWQRLRQFAARHPDWGLRVYRTPLGLRVLATHRTFHPRDPAVTDCFQALGTDELYRQLCLNQQCFRARVSPKPWRIGIKDRLRPRPGYWPVKPEHLPARHAWIERYEAAAAGFAACALAESLGNATVAPAVRPVLELHDALCQATTKLPLA